MNRDEIERHLALAQEHVEKGASSLASQRRIVAEMTEDHHPEVRVKALELLELFEQTQMNHVAEVERLRSELAQAD